MSRHCDALEAKKDGIFNMTGVAEQLRKDYSKFYSMLSELTGVSTDYFDAPLNLDHIRDPLFCEVSEWLYLSAPRTSFLACWSFIY